MNSFSIVFNCLFFMSQVRKASLARITCDNGDNINSIQPLAFRKPSAL